MIINNEKELVNEVSTFLRRSGFSVCFEVSTLGQSGDIIAQKGRWVTAIEAKMHDSKRVLVQCKVFESVADYICIAWGGSKVNERLYNIAIQKGYGIIVYDKDIEECRWYLRPKQNVNIWKPQRRVWLNKIREARDVPYV